MWDLSSLTRDRTCALCSGSAESYPLGTLGKSIYIYICVCVCVCVFKYTSYPRTFLEHKYYYVHFIDFETEPEWWSNSPKAIQPRRIRSLKLKNLKCPLQAWIDDLKSNHNRTTYCCCSVAQSWPTLCNPMDWLQHARLPGPSLFSLYLHIVNSMPNKNL